MEAPSVVLCEIYTYNYIGPENDYLTCSPGHCVGKLTVLFAVEPAVKFQKSANLQVINFASHHRCMLVFI